MNKSIFLPGDFCYTTSMMRTSESLTGIAYAKLREDILWCRLLPGSKVRIAPICDALEVSLGVVREALTRLAAEGLLRSEAQRGFSVPPIDMQDLTTLTDARIEIESLCLRRAIAAGDVGWESGIVASFHRLSRVGENVFSDEWVTAHAEFHAALVDGGKNQWLLRIRSQLYDQSERYRRLSVSLGPVKRDLLEEHRNLMDAALRRDADEAAECIREHLTLTTTVIIEQDLCDPATVAAAAERR
jgi:DNA-binding GntR family transcriptional regulator